jgi:fumarate reductase subunit D
MSALSAFASGRRARPGYLAAVVHRVSGIALAVFLPMHFLALGLALDAERFDAFLHWTDHPVLKLAEALLVAAFAVHMAGGLRLLAIEVFGVMATGANWIAAAFGFGLAAGLLFLLGAFA